MNILIPWKIIHLELSENIPALEIEPDYQGLYVVFWWQGIPVGDRVITATDLPIPATQLANLIVEAITPAIGDRLITGFETSFSEHFANRSKTPPNFQDLINLDRPLAKLTQSRSKSVETAEVSVVICTRDRPEQLAQCLGMLQTLSPQPQEVIVVDNAPTTDEVRQLVSQMPGVRYVLEPRPGLDIARNTGISHSKGKIIAFTDDDVVIHSNWLASLQNGFENPQVMAVTGLVLPAQLETESQIIFEWGHGCFGWGYRRRTFDRQFFQETKHLGVPVWCIGAGANMAFRREIFALVGNFDERLDAGASGCSGDSEMWYRILAEGWMCHYEPAAVVFHYHRRELDSLKKQMYLYMRGHVVALLVQFAKYRHWGNLSRLCWTLPKHYSKLLLGGLFKGYQLKHKTYVPEILGCLAGIQFYLVNASPNEMRSTSNLKLPTQANKNN